MFNLLLLSDKILGILIMAILTFAMWVLIVTGCIITKYLDTKKWK